MCFLYLCSQSPSMECPSRFSKAVWQSSKFPCLPEEASRCCWVACHRQQELKTAFLQQIAEISYYECMCVFSSPRISKKMAETEANSQVGIVCQSPNQLISGNCIIGSAQLFPGERVVESGGGKFIISKVVFNSCCVQVEVSKIFFQTSRSNQNTLLFSVLMVLWQVT